MRSDLSGGISLRFTAALERARELAGRPLGAGRAAPLPRPARRVRVIGDPQTSLDRFLRVLDAHELLGVDGYLADDVVLVSVGDHLDYAPHDGSDPGEDGAQILRWLAEHAPAQVVLLLGNHDAARVIELAGMTDARFARARALADELDVDAAIRGEPAALALANRFVEEFPDVPTPGLVRRDYGSWTEAQQRTVVDLLLAGRYRLGVAAILADGREALVTHAGVTTREVELLGADVAPRALAEALDARLAAAIAARRDGWRAGALAPLDLAPLHLPGEQPHEGGGLLYHRPSNPDRAAIPGDTPDRGWEQGARRRRFHPSELPRGLVQVAGHTTHRKCQRELRPWLTGAAASEPHGTLRTLIADGDRVVYDVGITGAVGAVAVLHLVDAEMNEPAKEPEDYPLLELAGLL